MKKLGQLIYLVLCIAVAMVGYEMHNSIFWSIIDFIFTPVVVIYWLITHQINSTLILETFSFILK